MPSGQKLLCKPGDVLFRPDDECQGFVVVEKGTIRVSLTAPNGREITLYRVRPGDICLQTFACLIEGRSYSAEGVVEDPLEARLLSHDEFKQQIASDDAFRAQIFSAVAHRFADFEQLVEDVALSDLEVRLARALIKLAEDHATVSHTHEDIATEIGSARAVVSRKLSLFERRGLVERQRGCVVLINPDELKSIADRAG